MAGQLPRMPEARRARSRMGVEGLRGIRAWAMTSASSLKTSSGKAEGEGIWDSGSGVSGGGVPHGSRSGERGDLGIYSYA